MLSWMEKLETWLSAAALAEGGDVDGAIAMSHGARKVLLAVREDDLDKQLLGRAKQLSDRMDAQLELLLLVEDDKTATQLEPFLSSIQINELKCNVVRGSNSLSNAVLAHLRAHGSIASVAIGSLASWGDNQNAEPWQHLNCPLVVLGSTS